NSTLDDTRPRTMHSFCGQFHEPDFPWINLPSNLCWQVLGPLLIVQYGHDVLGLLLAIYFAPPDEFGCRLRVLGKLQNVTYDGSLVHNQHVLFSANEPRTQESIA